MRISQVRYSRLWNTGDFTNESHSFTADLEPGESAEAVQCQLAAVSQEVHDVNQAYRKLTERIHGCTFRIAAIDDELRVTSEFCEDKQRLLEKTRDLENRRRQWQAKKAFLEKRRAAYLELIRASDWEKAKDLLLDGSRVGGEESGA